MNETRLCSKHGIFIDKSCKECQQKEFELQKGSLTGEKENAN